MNERLRPAEPRDLWQIKAIVAASYEKYLTRMNKAPAPVGRDYEDAIQQGLVWVLGDPVVGLVSFATSETALLIENVAVHPSAQGFGLGRRLLEFAEAEAADRGIHRVALYTNEAMTENVSLYEHLGFTEVERRTEDGYRRIYMEKTF